MDFKVYATCGAPSVLDLLAAPLYNAARNGNDYGKDLLRQHYQQHKHGS